MDTLSPEEERAQEAAEHWHEHFLVRSRGVTLCKPIVDHLARMMFAFGKEVVDALNLHHENDQLRIRAEEAEKLVAPAQNYNGVPDSKQSKEWNVGYRQRQREEWSRALYAENENRQLREALDGALGHSNCYCEGCNALSLEFFKVERRLAPTSEETKP